MHYQVIADEEKLLDFISWLPDLQENEKYYVSLFARKKYSEESIQTNDKTQLKRFTSDKERLVNKIRQLELPLNAWRLKNGGAPQESLALYIAPNPRCMRKATEMMGKRCWELLGQNNYNLHSEALTCIQKSKSRTCYVDFDIDDKDVDLDEKWLDNEIGVGNYAIIETRGGFHIMVKPDNATEFRRANYGDNSWYKKIQDKYPVDQSGDQLIPVVGAFQGGFVPVLRKK